MSANAYPVSVVCFINPYLIWVEVADTVSNTVSKNQINFEQIGLYGILPLDFTYNLENETMKVEKGDFWMPAVRRLLNEVWENNLEVWFSPTYLNRSSETVFDDNIHIFGDLMIKNDNGELKTISELLIQKNMAYLDVMAFHRDLSAGNLETSVSNLITIEVGKQIDRYYKNKIKFIKNCCEPVENQTSVHMEMLQKLYSTVTISNLQKHNNEMVIKILEKKAKDFELCNEVDEESVGRATKYKSIRVCSCLDERTDSYKSYSEKQQCLCSSTPIVTDDVRETESVSTNSLVTILSKHRHLLNLLQLKDEPRTDQLKTLETSKSTKTNEAKRAGYDMPSTSSIEQSNMIGKALLASERRGDNNNSSEALEEGKAAAYLMEKIERVFAKKVAYGPPDLKPIKFKIKNKRKEEDIVSEMIKEDKKPAMEISNMTKEKVEDKVTRPTKPLSILQVKRKILEDYCKTVASSSSAPSHKISIPTDSDDDIDDVIKRLEARDKQWQLKLEKPIETPENETVVINHSVNPFKNINSDISVFVDKLVSPVLLVHTKISRRVQPTQSMQDVCFDRRIHEVLKHKGVTSAMMLQTVSWPVILRGHSLFMISPVNSGKTMGYLPAVCRLVNDSSPIEDSAGPIAIIVCATAKLVVDIHKMAKQFLDRGVRTLGCFPGVKELDVTTFLLNGCDLLISTPVFLNNFLRKTDFCVDLRRLSVFVMDDCERLFDVYADDVKYFKFKIAEMLKKRVQKEMKVQYVLASRVWCDSMKALAIKVPDTVICIGAYQECVLYSKSNILVSFIRNGSAQKLIHLQEFLQQIDKTKKCVIVCDSDDEVDWLETNLKCSGHTIYATNNKMTVTDLYDLSVTWCEYKAPLVGPILICCDGNLMHMNVTDAHNLVHFSLPRLYSTFCKRFSVLNDNYPSIFMSTNSQVKIKVFVEESNAEQLPKIINFMKRCTEVPEVFDKLCQNILKEKDACKAKNYIPICDNLLLHGNCPDMFNCKDRHSILKEYDSPIEWLPERGIVTFKVLHCHSAVSYSGSLLSNIVDGDTRKYPQTHNLLQFKMGMYYSKEANRKLQGFPKVGDVCAVAINISRFVRCQVVKVLTEYERGNPNSVLVKLIDEEWYEVTRDIFLYYLPDELKSIETRVARIRLTNLTPRDSDVTFSNLAKHHIEEILESDDDLYVRGRVVLTIGNCIFVDTLEVCQKLAYVSEVIVKSDVKHELLENHAIFNENLLPVLKTMCVDSGLTTNDGSIQNVVLKCGIAKVKEKQNETKEVIEVREDLVDTVDKCNSVAIHSDVSNDILNNELNNVELSSENIDTDTLNYKNSAMKTVQSEQTLRKPSLTITDCQCGEWANFDKDVYYRIYIASFKNPENFFIRLAEFATAMANLLDEISIYVESIDNTEVTLRVGEIVLAKFSDESTYERARIGEIIREYVKCFSVDQGCWMVIPIDHLLPITDEIINRLPFQAIECKLLGVEPLDRTWSESANNQFHDYCFDVKNNENKMLHLKYITKSPSECTGGYKYGVILYDTENEGEAIMVNRLLIDVGVAKEKSEEIHFLELFVDPLEQLEHSNCAEKDLGSAKFLSNSAVSQLMKTLIRTVPLVDSDESDDDKWDVVIDGVAFQKIAPWVKDVPSGTIAGTTTKTTVNNDSVNMKANVTEIDSKHQTEMSKYPTKRPKLIWKQNLTTVTISILLIIGNYDLEIEDKALKFKAVLNDSIYGFDIELYGVIDKEKSTHKNEGLYISVNLVKIRKNKWLELTNASSDKNWVSYDVSTIDTSSDEEEVTSKDLENYVRLTQRDESESEDDEFLDDMRF